MEYDDKFYYIKNNQVLPIYASIYKIERYALKQKLDQYSIKYTSNYLAVYLFFLENINLPKFKFSYQQIANDRFIHRNTVKNIIHDFKKIGILTLIYDGKKNGNTNHFNFVRLVVNKVYSIDMLDNECPGGGQSMSGGVDNQCPGGGQSMSRKINKDNKLRSSSKKADDNPELVNNLKLIGLDLKDQIFPLINSNSIFKLQLIINIINYLLANSVRAKKIKNGNTASFLYLCIKNTAFFDKHINSYNSYLNSLYQQKKIIQENQIINKTTDQFNDLNDLLAAATSKIFYNLTEIEQDNIKSEAESRLLQVKMFSDNYEKLKDTPVYLLQLQRYIEGVIAEMYPEKIKNLLEEANYANNKKCF